MQCLNPTADNNLLTLTSDADDIFTIFHSSSQYQDVIRVVKMLPHEMDLSLPEDCLLTSTFFSC
jgi:hypothetical protein